MENIKFTNPFQPIQPSDRLVYLVTSDSYFAAHLSQQIIHFGYNLQHVRDFKNLSNAVADPNSVAVMLDISAYSNQPHNNDIFEEIGALQHPSVNFIFTSDQDDQIIRLKSIRAGGIAFFTKPINIVALIDKLDSLNKNNLSSHPSKVLIIEDQNAVANYYKMVLKMSGLDAQIATNLGSVLEQMREFHPDLILMNTFLSEINADDLARVI